MSIVLSGIFVYPVKALRGVAQNQAEVRPKGLADDRRWVIIDPAGRFISQRTHPGLARVEAQIHAGELTLSVTGHSDLVVKQPDGNERRAVSIWRDDVDAAAADPAADRWLTSVLGQPCNLAWMDPDCRRPITSEGASPGQKVSFADGYPCLITSEASLADLNGRLADPVPMNRFRPNLVVTGCSGFAEDTWSQLRIGDVVFRAAGPCARCAVTTVDQTSGQSLAPEPLKTLATFRLGDKGVNFGINLIVEQGGIIRIGDPVSVQIR